MADKVEIWVTVDCKKVIKGALLNQGIAMGNEYRFEQVAWKILVTRTADLFLDALKGALEHRITSEFPDIQPVWRMALGEDELLMVPPAEDRQRMLERIREIMAFLRGLLYERKFVGVVLRGVLTDVVASRSEENILAGKHDRQATAGRLVERLNALDLSSAEPAAEGVAEPPPAEPPPAEAPQAQAAGADTPAEAPQAQAAEDAPAEPQADDKPADDADDKSKGGRGKGSKKK